MQKYDKQYEDYYSLPRRLEQFNKQNIEVDGFETIEEYGRTIKDLLVSSQRSLFDNLVKLFWIVNKFKVNGTRIKILDSSIENYGYFNTFLKMVNNIDARFLMSCPYSRYLMTYFLDWYPGFYEGNPFKTKYEYPYKNLTLEHIVYVTRMDERLELLDIADKENMSIVKFYDYVINYVFCLNYEFGYEKYYVKRRQRNSSSHEIDMIKANKKI